MSYDPPLQPPSSPYDLVDCPQCDGSGGTKYTDGILGCSRCSATGEVELWTLDKKELKDLGIDVETQ